MKFLKHWDGKPIMPLNFIYHEGERYKPDDSLDVIYKDMTTGRKYVERIMNPKIEVAIVKPEYRTFEHFRDYIPAYQTYTIEVSYKNRWGELAKHLNLPYNEVKFCPYIFGSDLKIHTYYMMYFLREYHNDLPKNLDLVYLDTEADVRDFVGFPPIGAAPTTIISFLDAKDKQVYSFILRNPENPLVADLENRVDEFIQDCHEHFDASYGKLDYNVMFFDREIELLVSLFAVLREVDPDFSLVWNLPYDMQYLIERVKNLGYDPHSVICDPRFEDYVCSFEEDKNPLVHKRQHKVNLSNTCVWLDQMVVYEGIRSAGSKSPSSKLNYVARKELNDEKLDYSEETNIGEFPWKNFWKYCLYNIKDILLQYGIGNKTDDMTDIYTRCYGDALLPHEVFTTTTLLTNSFKMFIEDPKKPPEKFLMFGNNRNKIFPPSTSYIIESEGGDSEDEERVISVFGNPDQEDEDSGNKKASGKDGKKKEKFDGAIVSNANRMECTGTVLNGVPNPKIHDNAIDFDIGWRKTLAQAV